MESQDLSTISGTGYSTTTPPSYYLGRPILQVPGSAGGIGFEASELPPGVEPTHLLVGMGSYYLPVPVQSARLAMIVTILAIVLLILLLLAWAFSEQKQAPTINVKPQLKLKRKIRPLNAESRVAEAERIGYSTPLDATGFQDQNSCDAAPHSMWDVRAGRCRCIPPWWGANCGRESISREYMEAGAWNAELGKLGVISSSEVANLSFGDGEVSCTELCDRSTKCVGVLWERNEEGMQQNGEVVGRCTLLEEVTIAAGAELPFNPQYQSSLILKDSDTALKFENRVYIYGGRRAYRWWIYPRLDIPSGRVQKKQLMVEADHLYQITFFPRGIRGHTNLTGLYGTKPWTLAQFTPIVEQLQRGTGDPSLNSTYYLHSVGAELEVPLSWYNMPIWVMYSTPAPSSSF